ncbi:conserved hypothetical protein [Ricinus communis]|uniref:Uncharacterized protein n=1 Tax=Ricinus communis TaxID=3988 RepID=B9SE44_RICCO|nr:conserved hypothetical protein [Ricinus communis]
MGRLLVFLCFDDPWFYLSSDCQYFLCGEVRLLCSSASFGVRRQADVGVGDWKLLEAGGWANDGRRACSTDLICFWLECVNVLNLALLVYGFQVWEFFGDWVQLEARVGVCCSPMYMWFLGKKMDVSEDMRMVQGPICIFLVFVGQSAKFAIWALSPCL